MAQWWSYRYMLVDGHGNFGSMDGDSCRSALYWGVCLNRLKCFVISIRIPLIFKITMMDQNVSQSFFRHVFQTFLSMVRQGIAVGMATNIPPQFGLKWLMLSNWWWITWSHNTWNWWKVLSWSRLSNWWLGHGEIWYSLVHETGKGSIVLRSRTEIETTKSGRAYCCHWKLPYMVNKKVHEHIVRLAQEKLHWGDLQQPALLGEGAALSSKCVVMLLPMLSLNNLFKLTQLQTNFSFNIGHWKGCLKTFGVKSWLTILPTNKKLWLSYTVWQG